MDFNGHWDEMPILMGGMVCWQDANVMCRRVETARSVTRAWSVTGVHGSVMVAQKFIGKA